MIKKITTVILSPGQKRQSTNHTYATPCGASAATWTSSTILSSFIKPLLGSRASYRGRNSKRRLVIDQLADQ